MDISDRPNANLPARMPASLARQAVQLSATPRELDVVSSASPINSRQLLRGLVRNWWRILLIWLVVSSPSGLPDLPACRADLPSVQPAPHRIQPA